MAATMLSVEMRWFWRNGEAPENIWKMFKNTDVIERMRSDSYFVAPMKLGLNLKMDELGIKSREGKNVEVKIRLDSRVIQLSSVATGRLETWRKWSISTNEDKDKLEKELEKGDFWINTIKNRKLRKYDFDKKSGVVSEVGPGDRVDAGCGFELTKVDTYRRKSYVSDQEWWTLGFEAFGADEPEKVSEIMKATFNHVQKTWDLGKSELIDGNSYGYPRWLSELAA
jgi:hypothetical protein